MHAPNSYNNNEDSLQASAKKQRIVANSEERKPQTGYILEERLKESIKESREQLSMLNFNCVTFASIKDIGIVDFRKSSIMVFDNLNMRELA